MTSIVLEWIYISIVTVEVVKYWPHYIVSRSNHLFH